MSTVTPRQDRQEFTQHAPAMVHGLLAAAKVAETSGLDRKLLELVKLRASQINGCAFCARMHAADARKAGETETRLDLLPAWHHAPGFDARDRAALAWTEALTRMAQAPVSDAVYAELQAQFSAAEIAVLTSIIASINAWNRIAGSLHFTPMA